MAGPIGLYWAVHNATRVGDIVLLNTLVYPELSWAAKGFLFALRTPLVRDFIVSPRAIAGTMKFGVVHKDRLTREALAAYTSPFETAAARKALIKAGAGLTTEGLAEIAEKLPSLEASLRLIYGEKDLALPDVAKTMRRVQGDHPLAELTAIPNCGHFLQEDEPEQVGALIADFFNRANPITATKSAAPPTTAEPRDQAPRNSPTPTNPTPAEQAADVIAAFNTWDRNDLDLPPAAVTEATVQSLPTAARDLIALLPEPHRAFMRDACGPGYETLTFGAPQTTTTFDLTADILPPAADTPAGREAHAEAERYFNSRRITHLEVTGNDNGRDLLITLRIAHDPEASLLFTFLRVSD